MDDAAIKQRWRACSVGISYEHFREGFLAYSTEGIEDSPYYHDTLECVSWEEGWIAGHRETRNEK